MKKLATALAVLLFAAFVALVPVDAAALKPDETESNWASHFLYQLAVTGTLTPRMASQQGVFDCSETAGYLDWVFSRRGYQSYIVISTNAEQKAHAWVFVRLDNHWFVVDNALWLNRRATLQILSEYSHAEEIYNDCYEADRAWPGEFDWWDSSYPLEEFAINFE